MPPFNTAPPLGSNTTYLSVVDGERNAVSFINSIYFHFGSTIVAGRSGVLLQNRGYGFTLEPGHPNAIGPGKRPFHTIIPGMVARDGATVMAYGVMGGAYQPTGHVHFLTNLLDFAMDVQGALDAPRAFHHAGSYALERGVPAATAEGLAQRGHALAIAEEPLGGGQAIFIDWPGGSLIGGSDPRKDGCALGF